MYYGRSAGVPLEVRVGNAGWVVTRCDSKGAVGSATRGLLIVELHLAVANVSPLVRPHLAIGRAVGLAVDLRFEFVAPSQCQVVRTSTGGLLKRVRPCGRAGAAKRWWRRRRGEALAAANALSPPTLDQPELVDLAASLLAACGGRRGRRQRECPEWKAVVASKALRHVRALCAP